MHTTMLRAALFAASLSLITGCLSDPELGDEDFGETAIELSTSDWSTPQRVGADLQEAWKGGDIATHKGITYMVHSGTRTNSYSTDTSELWWTWLTPTGWANDIKISGQTSQRRVSLASFNGNLYMLHSGNTNVNEVWLSRFNETTQTWSSNTKLAFTSAGAPGMAAFGNMLRIVGVTPSTNQLFEVNMSTSEVFSAPVPLTGLYSSAPVSLAAYGGRLFMAHGVPGGLGITSTTNGTAWTVDYPIPANASEGSLAPNGGYLHLVLARRLSTDPYISDRAPVYWTYFDGVSWPAPITVGAQQTSVQPRIATRGNPWGEQVGIHMLTAGNDYGVAGFPVPVKIEKHPLYTSTYRDPLPVFTP